MDRELFGRWLADPKRRALVMGIINVTPDSFSDGGQCVEASAAVERAKAMSDSGARIIDIGGESTRPGSAPVEAGEQLRRILPVIEQVAKRLPVVVSVDTTSAAVAERALDAGAGIINDVSAGRIDPLMLPLAARRGAPIILMHMQGEPRTMQADPTYQNVVAEVAAFLQTRAQAAQKAGVPAGHILIDPGIGFGKNTEHNLRLLGALSRLCGLGHPVVMGTSRKRFIGQIIGEEDPGQRIMGTAATVAWSVAHGASIVRVHDAAAMSQVVAMTEAIMRSGE